MYALLVQFDVLPEHRDAFIQVLIEDGRGSLRDEPGTLRFDVVQDGDNPNRFYLYEAYRDRAAFDAHLQGPHFRKAWASIEPWLAAPGIALGSGVTIFPPSNDGASG